MASEKKSWRYRRVSGDPGGSKKPKRLQMVMVSCNNSNKKGGGGVMWRLKKVVRFIKPTNNSPSSLSRPLFSENRNCESISVMKKLRKRMANVRMMLTSLTKTSSSVKAFNAKMVSEMYRSIGIHLNADEVRSIAKELRVDLSRPEHLLLC